MESYLYNNALSNVFSMMGKACIPKASFQCPLLSTCVVCGNMLPFKTAVWWSRGLHNGKGHVDVSPQVQVAAHVVGLAVLQKVAILSFYNLVSLHL